MNLLLDTHVILWFLTNDPKLSAAARLAILDPGNTRWAYLISNESAPFRTLSSLEGQPHSAIESFL